MDENLQKNCQLKLDSNQYNIGFAFMLIKKYNFNKSVTLNYL